MDKLDIMNKSLKIIIDELKEQQKELISIEAECMKEQEHIFKIDEKLHLLSSILENNNKGEYHE